MGWLSELLGRTRSVPTPPSRADGPPEEIVCTCGGREFLAGPRGGLCQNVECLKCGKRYNVTPFGVVPL